MAIIRQGTPNDALAIGAIYNHYIEHSVATFALHAHDDAYWQDWCSQFADTGPHQIFVAEEEGAVVGFAYSLPYNDKGGYAKSVLTSIYLDATYLADNPGPGLGTKLYDALFKSLAPKDVHRIYAWIALPNDASMALHHSFGFIQVAQLSEVGFKHGRYIDLAVMEKAP